MKTNGVEVSSIIRNLGWIKTNLWKEFNIMCGGDDQIIGLDDNDLIEILNTLEIVIGNINAITNSQVPMEPDNQESIK